MYMYVCILMYINFVCVNYRDTFPSSAAARFDTEASVKLITHQAVASILQGAFLLSSRACAASLYFLYVQEIKYREIK